MKNWHDDVRGKKRQNRVKVGEIVEGERKAVGRVEIKMKEKQEKKLG